MTVYRRSAVKIIAAFGLAMASLASVSAYAQSAADGEAMIKKASDEALGRLAKDPSLASGDSKKINALIDEVIMPTVNFPRMTALAVGRDWRTATPEQKKAMTEEFRALLVRTYSTGITSAKDSTVRFKPSRQDADDLVVRTEFVPKRGEPIPFDYRMEKVDGQWKIYDVSILGSWLVQSYRAQFAPELSSKGMDGLIKSLADKRKSLEGK